MTESNDSTREFDLCGHTWRWEQLGDTSGALLCLTPEIRDGVDESDWPEDAELSDVLGMTVAFFDGGDDVEYPSGIYDITRTYEWVADWGGEADEDDEPKLNELALAYCEDNPARGVEIRDVRAPRDGEIRGLYEVRRGQLQILAYEVPEDVQDLTNRAWEHAWERYSAEQSSVRFAVGDRVCGGEPGTEDYDEGTVLAIDGEQVDVGWDSGVRTTQSAELLEPCA